MEDGREDAGGRPAADPALRDELLGMRAHEEAMRATIARRYRRPEDVSEADQRWWLEVEAANIARLRAIVAERGWPGVSLVGDEAEEAAWQLAQHADQDPALQRRCLRLLERAVADGEAPGYQLAYLTDRVCVNARQRQVYGTQMHMAGGEIVPWPIEDPDRVDERRAAAGLGPLAEYLASVRRPPPAHQPPTA